MKRKHLYVATVGLMSLVTGVLIVWFVWLVAAKLSQSAEAPGVEPPVTRLNLDEGRRISGPYAFKNLTVFFVHGKERLPSPVPEPLEQALEKRFAKVYETSNVEQLEIENLSESTEVFLQAGDIVKGGQQDRILNVDLIVPAKSGRIPIDSFCVEQGRWAPRGRESAFEFSSSSSYAPSRNLKMAAKVSKSQSEVWDEVAESQERLGKATDTEAKSMISESSLQLTLEHEAVKSRVLEYMRAIGPALDEKDDVIGFVFAINGVIGGGETYGANALFKKVWPKLLRASATEAIAMSQNSSDKKSATINDIEKFLKDAEGESRSTTRSVTKRIQMRTFESSNAVYTESSDSGRFLHGSYVPKSS